jgi:dihydrolipoamide dehydrogenase
MEEYDLVILGGGPGGYVTAERAGKEKMRVLVVEKDQLGGVCLNAGCIPTKTLLNAAKIYKNAKSSATLGVSVEGARFDLARAMAWKEQVVEGLRKGIAFQMKRYGVEVVTGHGAIADPRTVTVTDASGGSRSYRGRSLIVATGSSPLRLRVPGADKPHVVDSTGILRLTSAPRSLAIIGGGVIGMEFACFFAAIGVKVTVIEMMPEIIPVIDPELARTLRTSLPEITFELGATVTEITDRGVRFTRGQEAREVEADLVLVAVSRKPNVEGNGFEAVGLDFDRAGIRVDGSMRTNLPAVYAAGDVTGKHLYAHAASRMGEIALNGIRGRNDRLRTAAIPWVVYTFPEIAGVGPTEAEALAQGRKVKTAQVQMRANGRFVAENEKGRGVCKVVVDAESGALLGVHLIGAYASEIVGAATAMVEAELRVNDIRDLVLPHPTVSELVREAVWEL